MGRPPRFKFEKAFLLKRINFIKNTFLKSNQFYSRIYAGAVFVWKTDWFRVDKYEKEQC